MATQTYFQWELYDYNDTAEITKSTIFTNENSTKTKLDILIHEVMEDTGESYEVVSQVLNRQRVIITKQDEEDFQLLSETIPKMKLIKNELVKFGGMSFSEIGKVMDISAQGACESFKRAMQKIQTISNELDEDVTSYLGEKFLIAGI